MRRQRSVFQFVEVLELLPVDDRVRLCNRVAIGLLVVAVLAMWLAPQATLASALGAAVAKAIARRLEQ